MPKNANVSKKGRKRGEESQGRGNKGLRRVRVFTINDVELPTLLPPALPSPPLRRACVVDRKLEDRDRFTISLERLFRKETAKECQAMNWDRRAWHISRIKAWAWAEVVLV